jgi:hypothetical protein
MAQVHSVVIRRGMTNNPSSCFADPFSARPGDTVKFRFQGVPSARIEFDNSQSPFEGPPGFNLESDGAENDGAADKTVKAAQPAGTFTYKITWSNGGSGNGGGEVLPSR